MKKFMSVLLAVVLVFGLTSVAFASSDRVKGSVKAIDSNNPVSSYMDTRPGSDSTLKFPLTADMFSWSSGQTGVGGTAVNRSQMGSAKVTYSGTNTKVIKSAEIKYEKSAATGGNSTAVVVVEFIDPFVSAGSLDYDVSMFLTIGSRQSESRVILSGNFANPEKTVSSGTSYEDISGGYVLKPTETVRNLSVHIGANVDLFVNVFSGTKYYGTATEGPTVDDEKVISRYPSIIEIIRVNTVGFSKGGKMVSLKDYSNRWVYAEDGAFLGRSNVNVEYSGVYYLASSDLGKEINTGYTGGSGGSGSSSSSSSSSSTSSEGGSGGTGGTVSTGGTISKSDATTLANNAVATAKSNGSKTAVVKLSNKAVITIDALKEIDRIAVNAGMGSVVYADTVSGKNVVSRLYIYPARAKNLTTDVKIGSQISGAQVNSTQTKFDKYFSNKKVVMSLDQDNTFNMSVEIAAKVNMSGLDKSNIYFYSYNRAQNKYYLIKTPGAWIDNSGFLRFTTTLAGDIIISEGPLKK